MNRKNGFNSLIATQFLGAFNDNVFKFVIAALMINQMSETGSTLLLSLSSVVFILPFLIFSSLAGQLADRYSKRNIIVMTKIMEVAVMSFGFLALWTQSIAMMLGVLFLMGLQSTLFSPAKYGILPEILSEEKLSEGNGKILMWTYIAILLGQSSYGFLMNFSEPNYHQMAFVFIAIAGVGLLTSFGVHQTEVIKAKNRINHNPFSQIKKNVKEILQYRPIYLSILGLSYFGFIGALFQLNILVYAKEMMNVNHLLTGFLIAALTIGMGFGCWLAGRWSDEKVELGIVPMGSLGMSWFSFCLVSSYPSYLKTLLILFCLGVSAGFFIVPLNALIQQQSDQKRRGQFLAVNNFFSFTAALFGSLMMYVFHDFLHLNSAQVFLVMSLVTIAVGFYIISLLPYSFLRMIVWIIGHTIYKVKTIDRFNIPKTGGALLACNHVSYVDAVLLIISSQRPVRFMVSRTIYENKFLNPIFKLAKCIPVLHKSSPKELAKSLDAARQALRDGELVCIFPEGQLTRTGNMLKFNRGVEMIMKNVDCPIIPVHLDRIWGSIFSYERGKFFFKRPHVFPYPVTVSFGKSMPSDSSVFDVRQAVMELGAQAFPHRLQKSQTLSERFWKEARVHPFQFCMADSTGIELSNAKALIGAVSLSKIFQKTFKNSKYIGVVLPSSVAGSLVNTGLLISKKIPVNINFTASNEAVESMVQQCDMKVLLTSKKFLNKLKNKDQILNLNVKVFYVEDLFKSISVFEKLISFSKIYLLPWFLSHKSVFGFEKRSIQDLATIMFTSGSTGEPKGVMLTHENITSNIEGLYQVFSIEKNDKILGSLPFFHSFGFTATMWMPLISEIGAVYHANPLDSKTIGEMIQKHQISLLMSTPTFLQGYIRKCDSEQLKSLRLVMVGAEKLKEQTAKQFEEKFGVRPMEGYGCTELSPIVSLNLPDYRKQKVKQKSFKPGKIGMPLPGVVVKIINADTREPVGVNESGLLFVKGPNVMKGYLKKEDLTQDVIQNGWYNTGDIANMDEDGFLQITDRLSRFSKIAGEMVPHIKVEEAIHEVLESSGQLAVVVGLPDEKKGEKLVCLCLEDINVSELILKLRDKELPNLWIPAEKMFFKTNEIPVLATGKIDMTTVKKIILEKMDEEQ